MCKLEHEEKIDNFIGKTFNNGKLKVVGVHGKNKHGQTIFKLTCEVCSQDPELFPEGYFTSVKSSLVNGGIPCGCSDKPEWSAEQYLTRVDRLTNKKFIIHGFSEKYKGIRTKLNCECLIDSHKWTASIHNILNGKGCPKCAGRPEIKEQGALENCITICQKMNYEVIGFPNGYKNNRSRFEYICPKHGKQSVKYTNFVNNGTRCGGCWKESGNGNGYFPERAEEQDFLYVLNFNDQFIKIGRSFDVDSRIDNLKTPSVSGIENINKFRIFTATHQEIYNYEQEILNELRPKYQYFCDWTTETLINESLPDLNKILDECQFNRIL